METSINVGQAEVMLIQGIFSLIGIGLIYVVAPLALNWLKARTTLIDKQTEDVLLTGLHVAVARSVQYAISQTQGAIDPNQKIDVKNPLVASAANYLISQAPEKLEHYGIKLDVNDPGLQKLVLAHVPAALQEQPDATTGVTQK